MYGPVRGCGSAAARASPYGKLASGGSDAAAEAPEEETEAVQPLVLGSSKVTSGGRDASEGAWTCKGCNNVNYRHREVCNTRKCALPRYLGDSILDGHPEGSWLCLGCGNVNYKHRMACHTRKCGLPYPGLAMQPFAGQLPMVSKMFMGPSASVLAAHGVPLGKLPMASKMFMGPPASVLAAHGIPLGKEPAALASPMMGGMWTAEPEPPGSWRCPMCANLNYASREVCNTRKCRAPRPTAVNGGCFPAMSAAFAPVAFTPAAPVAGGRQQGSWTCSQCWNVNYGFRTTCNTRKCQAPRPY
mmetsp:Transcript_118478/g.330515  ORF Transcript_118478/g.330515 Transcript_118478/m.330515 type:complete len:301 (+) Transcript_118478:114-1016(+)